MPDSQQPNRRVPWAMIVVAMSLIAYPLSIGPVYGLLTRGYVSAQGVATAYYPLHWLVAQSETVTRFFNWYIRLFLP